MKLSDFNYDLPEELIAQDPLEKRSDSRLMVVGREDGSIEHKHFYDIIDYLNPGDCLVINDTKVIPARLMGVKEETGASIEVLLLKRKEEKVRRNAHEMVSDRRDAFTARPCAEYERSGGRAA